MGCTIEGDFEGGQQAHLAWWSDGEPNRGGAQVDPTDDEELYWEVYTGGDGELGS